MRSQISAIVAITSSLTASEQAVEAAWVTQPEQVPELEPWKFWANLDH
jgi:hypothetical protein